MSVTLNKLFELLMNNDNKNSSIETVTVLNEPIDASKFKSERGNTVVKSLYVGPVVSNKTTLLLLLDGDIPCTLKISSAHAFFRNFINNSKLESTETAEQIRVCMGAKYLEGRFYNGEYQNHLFDDGKFKMALISGILMLRFNNVSELQLARPFSVGHEGF